MDLHSVNTLRIFKSDAKAQWRKGQPSKTKKQTFAPLRLCVGSEGVA
jgi:hypothetical protein